VEAQAIDRSFRIGQVKNVFVHKMVCSATFEEKIDQMIEAKRELTELSIGAGEQWITQMSNDELSELFALSNANRGIDDNHEKMDLEGGKVALV
jgi:SNF2 family DNA or RNA helicase